LAILSNLTNEPTEEITFIPGLELESDSQESDSNLFALQNLLLNQSEQLVQQQQQLNILVNGFLEMTEILKQQQKILVIEDINQSLDTLGKAMVNTYKKIDKIDVSKDLASFEAEQQTFRKTLEKNQQNLKQQSENLADYLDWKRTAVIIVITAIISSVSSLAIAHLVLSNQSAQKDQNSTQTEKPVNSKPKKISQQKR
jgi:hypothetical protein